MTTVKPRPEGSSPDAPLSVDPESEILRDSLREGALAEVLRVEVGRALSSAVGALAWAEEVLRHPYAGELLDVQGLTGEIRQAWDRVSNALALVS